MLFGLYVFWNWEAEVVDWEFRPSLLVSYLSNSKERIRDNLWVEIHYKMSRDSENSENIPGMIYVGF